MYTKNRFMCEVVQRYDPICNMKMVGTLQEVAELHIVAGRTFFLKYHKVTDVKIGCIHQEMSYPMACSVLLHICVSWGS